MRIECKIHRQGGTRATIDGVEYHFKPASADDPRHVAEVADEDHASRFLAIPEGYRVAKSGTKAERDKAEAAAEAERKAKEIAEEEARKAAEQAKFEEEQRKKKEAEAAARGDAGGMEKPADTKAAKTKANK